MNDTWPPLHLYRAAAELCSSPRSAEARSCNNWILSKTEPIVCLCGLLLRWGWSWSLLQPYIQCPCLVPSLALAPDGDVACDTRNSNNSTVQCIIHNPTTLPPHVSYFISIISINFIIFNQSKLQILHDYNWWIENERYSQSNVKEELADEN